MSTTADRWRSILAAAVLSVVGLVGAACSSNGEDRSLRFLAACLRTGDDSELCEVSDKGQVRTMGTAATPGSAISVDEAGRRVALSTPDGVIILDIASSDSRPISATGSDPQFVSDDHVLVYNDGRYELVDLKEETVRTVTFAQRLTPTRGARTQPGGSLVAVPFADEDADETTTVCVYELSTLVPVERWCAPAQGVTSLAVGLDGAELALVRGNRIEIVGRDGAREELAPSQVPITTPAFGPEVVVYVDARGALVLADRRVRTTRPVVDLSSKPDQTGLPTFPVWLPS